MPSIAAHFALAKKISKLINMENNDDFYRGNALPDIINKKNSHYRKKEDYCLVPNINEFLKNEEVSSPLMVGYLCHLLLDKHFLEDYVPLNIKNYNKKNVFTLELIYRDYSLIGDKLLKYFDVDLNYINRIIKNYNCPLLKDKYQYIIDCVNIRDMEGNTSVLDINSFEAFLNDIADTIAREIKQVISKRKIIIASNNNDKMRELKQIFTYYDLSTLRENNVDVDVIEDQDTFYGNASKKAHEIYEITHLPVIADDSGICITALNDWPGVMTHRFAGDNIDEEARNKLMIKAVNEKCPSNRKAKVICSLVYYDGDKEIVGTGTLAGTITTSIRGNYGFGFDKIFQLDNGKTLGELTPNEKNNMSARYLAAIKLNNKLIMDKTLVR